MKELIKNSTLFQGDDLEFYIDWLFNNKLKRTVEERIEIFHDLTIRHTIPFDIKGSRNLYHSMSWNSSFIK